MAELGGGRGDGGDRAREEFFSEAQEIVDGLSRDLLQLDELVKRGESDPELVNDVFRAVHTMKGLSGLFGAATMSGLSHELEDLLDDLRLGRIELSGPVLDLLFQSVELYGHILAAVKGDAPEPAVEVKALLVKLGQVSQAREGGGASVVAQYELDPGLLGVLTEYEEHRLRANIQQGLSLFRIHVAFSLASIDSALDDLKARAKPHGEIITYLPTGTGGDIETIELEILLASRAAIDVLRAAIFGPNISIEEVRRRQVSDSLSGIPAGASIAPGNFREESRPQGSIVPATMVGGSGIPISDGPGNQRSAPPAPLASAPPPAAAGQTPAARDLSLRSVSQTVRVDIRKLDHLMNIVGELAIVRTAMMRLLDRSRARPELRELAVELQRMHRTFDRHLMQMQNGILEVRMVPLGQVFDKLARIVRQISREHDKQVNLVITGAETEIDKLIVEELSDPLMHMMRNAIDHGIEAREDRLRVGKPPVGTIALNAFQKGNHVVIEVEDDGAGMDTHVILKSAVRLGFVTAEEAQSMTARELLAMVFTPGFTTREGVTNLSGRGVGMDIVKTNISALGGIVDIASEVGIGTKITVTLPITLAIIAVLVIEVARRTYCLPLASVEEAIALDSSHVRVVEGREVMTVRGATLPICRLATLFGHATPGETTRATRGFVVIAKVGTRRMGIVVDRLVGQQDIVIKALGASLKHVRGFAGATELGDQRVGLVLDASALLDEVLAGGAERHASYEGESAWRS